MKVVFFIEGKSEENGENEVHIQMEFFPMVGDTIVLEDEGYIVTHRYAIVRNLNPTHKQATWVQYTAHLKRDE